MSCQQGPIPMGIMKLIAQKGSANYLEIEQVMGPVNALIRISKLYRDGYITPLKKERGQLKRYALTRSGAAKVGELVKQQRHPSAMDFPHYTPSMFTPVRPGAMAAFSIQSRGF